MTLDAARRLSAHVAIAAAFGSMAISGNIPIWGVLLFAGVFVVAFILRGRLPAAVDRPLTFGTAGVLLLLGWLTISGQIDLVVAASGFAAVLAGNRMLLRRRAADDGLLYLVAVMMLGGGALSADVRYAFFFGVFAIAFTL